MTKFTKFLVGAVVAVAVFASSASASYTHTGVLKMGMTSSQVQSLQKTLNGGGFLISTTGAGSPGMESMYFGAKTKAAVMSFQVAKGLMADGVVGAQTGTALAAMTGGSVSFPAGCSSTTGFSTTTGQPCTSTASTTLPAGCVAGAMFSSTTGASCAGGSSTGPLTGGAGDITVTSTSNGVGDSDVKEGDSNHIVLGAKVEADNGSDVALTNVKLTFVNSNSSSSKRLTRYADTVSVWLGSKKVGSASVDDFTKDGNNYSKSIVLSGAVIKADEKANLYVAVDAIDNIDSTDLNSDAWSVEVDNIRFSDASGAVLTSTGNGSDFNVDETFNFTDLSTSGDVKVKVTEGSNNPEAQNVEVSDTSATSGVTMLEFKIKAEGSDVTFDSLPVHVNTTGANGTEIFDELALMNGSDEIDTVDAPSNTSGTVTFDFDDDFTISEGDTETFKVVAKIKKVANANFDQGDSASVSFDAINRAAVGFEDENGDAITGGNLTGTVTGEVQTFYSEGVQVSGFTSSVSPTSNTSGTFSKQTYTVSYKVTAFGNDYYIPKGVDTSASSNSIGLVYSVETSAGATNTSVTASASSLSSSADTVGGYYKVADGETKTFNVTLELTKGSATAGFYRVQLGAVRYDTDQSGTPASYTLAPAQNYETADAKLD